MIALTLQPLGGKYHLSHVRSRPDSWRSPLATAEWEGCRVGSVAIVHEKY